MHFVATGVENVHLKILHTYKSFKYVDRNDLLFMQERALNQENRVVAQKYVQQNK